MQSQATNEYAFVHDFCVSALLSTQNSDGGWGFAPNSATRVEPTCWAVRALRNANIGSQEPWKAAIEFLLSSQLKDGSWPAVPGASDGCWATSLACSVLSDDREHQKSIQAGLKWLCGDFPRDSTLWRRMFSAIRSSNAVNIHDDSFRGWGWTPRTSSWVEPTAFAMQALSDVPAEWRPRSSASRLSLAVGLLYDRMCPGGGWNCGNPMVYGVAGEPLVLPTCWALLALHHYPSHERKSMSLDWLLRTFPIISSPASLAVARITLETYGKECPKLHHDLREILDPRTFSYNAQVVSWISLALSPDRQWFAPAEITT